MTFLADALESTLAKEIAEQQTQDAVSALQHLKFNKSEATKRVMDASRRMHGNYSLEDLIKESLKSQKHEQNPQLQGASNHLTFSNDVNNIFKTNSESASGQKKETFFDMLARNNANFKPEIETQTQTPKAAPQQNHHEQELHRLEKEDNEQFKKINENLKEIKDYIKEQTLLFKQQLNRNERSESKAEREHTEDVIGRNAKPGEDYKRGGRSFLQTAEEAGLIAAITAALGTFLEADFGPIFADIYNWIKKSPEGAKKEVHNAAETATGLSHGLRVSKQVKAAAGPLLEDASKFASKVGSAATGVEHELSKIGGTIPSILGKGENSLGISATDAFLKSKNVPKEVIKIFGRLSWLKNLGGKIPVIGMFAQVIIDELVSYIGTGSFESMDQFKKTCVEAIASNISAEVLAALGAVIGTFFFPAGGTLLGGLAGGLLGAFGGQYIAEKIYDMLDSGDVSHLTDLTKKQVEREKQNFKSSSSQTASGNTKISSTQLKQAKSDVGSLEKLGLNKANAEGIAANIQAESGGDIHAIGDNGEAYGLLQWHKDRQANFKKLFGHDIQHSTRDEQLQFIAYELKHGEKKTGNLLKDNTSAGMAAAIFSTYDERPADIVKEANARSRFAELLDKSLTSNQTTANPPVIINSSQKAAANPTPSPETMGNVPGPDADRNHFDVASYWSNLYLLY